MLQEGGSLTQDRSRFRSRSPIHNEESKEGKEKENVEIIGSDEEDEAQGGVRSRSSSVMSVRTLGSSASASTFTEDGTKRKTKKRGRPETTAEYRIKKAK